MRKERREKRREMRDERSERRDTISMIEHHNAFVDVLSQAGKSEEMW